MSAWFYSGCSEAGVDKLKGLAPRKRRRCTRFVKVVLPGGTIGINLTTGVPARQTINALTPAVTRSKRRSSPNLAPEKLMRHPFMTGISFTFFAIASRCGVRRQACQRALAIHRQYSSVESSPTLCRVTHYVKNA